MLRKKPMERRLYNVPAHMVRALAILVDDPRSMVDTGRVSGISNRSCSENQRGITCGS